MTREELFKKNFPEYVTEKGTCLSPFWDIFCAGLEAGETKQHNLPDFAVDFGETLDECAKELEEANKANEWHYVNWKYFADEDYPESESALYLVRLRNKDVFICVWGTVEGFGCFWDNNIEPIDNDDIYAWKEIVPPEE